MTEHDLAIAMGGYREIDLSSSGGAEKKRDAAAAAKERYTAKRFGTRSRHHTFAMLNGEPIGYAQSYVALGSGDGWWKKKPIQEYAE